jgi:hypothetical protein
MQSVQRAIESDRTLRTARKDIARLREINAEYERRIEELTAVQEFLSYEPNPRRAVEGLAKGTRRSGSREAVAVVLASDWHVEETVTLEQTNGVNEMDLSIAEARIERLARGTVRLIEMSRHGADVRRLVVALIGDIVNGYLRDENLIGNALTPPEAIVWAWERIVRMLEYIRDNAGLDNVHVVCRSGNHGRFMGLSTTRVMWSEKESMSLEHVLFSMLAARFRGDKVLTFDVPKAGVYTEIEILGYLYRFFHGDNVKYQGGVGGLAVPLTRLILRLNQRRKAYQHCLGHFHSTHWLPNANVNGSLIGFDAYATALGFDVEPPQQSYFLVRRGRGQDERKSIFLDRD